MGNTSAKPHPRQRNKKQVHWKAADRPAPPGKPHLVSETEATPDVITIRWHPPLKDGGSPTTGYLVEHRRTGSPHWVRATPLLVPFPELTLSGLEPGWRYQFRVSAENAVGMSIPSELSEPLTVTLQRSAITSPRFTQELSDTVALENEKVEFVAHFLGQPAPKICWFKDGFEIFSSRRTRILTESDRSVLTIHQGALCDEGEIKCTATNKAGHASTKARLTLEAPPSIRLPRQYEDGLLFEIGEVMRLKVSVAGLPAPLVFWSHNGETIQNDERYEIDNSDRTSTLKVAEAKRTDRGEYQIKAANKLGQETVSFLVTVTDKPSQPGKAVVVMTLGKSVTLAWNTPEDDGGCKIGNYIIEYYRLGWDVWLKAATSRQLTAVLGDLIEGSEYKFRVKAESPYGVSEPSQESEIVFIPDPKRGILAAPTRSRSQPRDIPFSQAGAPVLPQRKNKPRSSSSTRVESSAMRIQFDNLNSGVPVRPDRTKIKSPSKTPETSPAVVRRDINSQMINKALFDRASITRDLTYGSPEIKMKKNDDIFLPQKSRSRSPSPFVNKQPTRSTIQIIDNRRPRSPSPRAKSRSPSPNRFSLSPTHGEKSRSPSPITFSEKGLAPSPTARRKGRSPSPSKDINKGLSPSPYNDRKRFFNVSADNTDNGSSEFMLVLLPNGEAERRDSDMDFNFDENLIPPPLSLSAPELGAEPPPFIGLKYSSSSSELLHERAMMRFYEAAEAEEAEFQKRLDKGASPERRTSVIPKIQINSKDEEEIVGLERSLSLRRRYSGSLTATQQQIVWAHRRQSLRNSGDYTDVTENKLRKFPLTIEEKREIMMNRKRSESEEKEEKEFESIRERLRQNRPKLEHRKNVDIVDVDKWEVELNEKEEYEESLSDEESESEDDRIYDQVPNVPSEEEEDRTYHPRIPNTKADSTPKVNNEPFEILTKPNKLPDPNFVPKPILKNKPEDSKLNTLYDQRQRSYSESAEVVDDVHLSPLAKRPSLPWTSGFSERARIDAALNPKMYNTTRRGSSPTVPMQTKESRGISAVASISGLAAASVVIPKNIMARKKDEEEAKIVVDHYSELVRNYGQKGKNSTQYDRHKINGLEQREASRDAYPEVLEKRTTQASPQTNVENKIFDSTNTNSSENTRTLNGDHTRIRNDSESSRASSQRSSSSTKSKRGSNRSGSPTVLNKEVYIRGREAKISDINKRTPSKSPGRRSSSSRTSSKSPGRSRKTTSSPTPYEMKWSAFNRKSPSPITARTDFSAQTRYSPLRKSKSPSPRPTARARPPKMKEIMTQTSASIDAFINETASKLSAPFKRKLTQTELERYAEIKVRTMVDYITDLAMFAVACWLYLFSNELFAIPVLIIMVYRELQEAVRKRLPTWLLPKPKPS